MYIGIDLGTSGVKVILLNEQGEVVAAQTEKLTVSRPHPLWSEQDPEQWWQATDRAMKALGDQHSLQDVKALGIAGQMHGATLLDAQQRVLRPAILWNDGRCAQECTLLEARVPQSRVITGNLMMPGFTAPKLLWVQRHEPEIFRQIDKVLLPKDYLRLRMTGEFASDMSDAAGTMWLDVAKRDWSDVMLQACDLSRDQMPALYEGSEITGALLPEVAKAWGMATVPVVAGGGDNWERPTALQTLATARVRRRTQILKSSAGRQRKLLQRWKQPINWAVKTMSCGAVVKVTKRC